MLVRSLIPWVEFTRLGIPPVEEFRVIRRPMEIGGVGRFEPGDLLTPGAITSRTRLRQLYEQRMIEPVTAPVGSVQRARERMQAANQSIQDTPSSLGVSALAVPFTDPVAIADSSDRYFEEPSSLPPPPPSKYQRGIKFKYNRGT